MPNPKLLISATALATIIAVSSSAQTENRFWLLWEQIDTAAKDCAKNSRCPVRRNYTTRLLNTPANTDIHNTIGMLDRLALSRGQPVEHPEAPRICQNRDPEVLLGFDPERWEMSEKLEALKDLPGVYFSVTRLAAPDGYAGNFGQNLQAEFERRFRAAGIRILSEAEMNATPGKPQLNIYFSRANRVTGCRYSVFASLSQTMLLTRNINVKLKVGTWGLSEGPSADYPNHTEYDAILRVADAFISNYVEANSTNYVARR